VLFKQERLGLHGQPFHCVKFRTMVDGSEGDTWTLPGDARVTRVGRILRRAHLDELPQFWNVLRGEMAIVGPRPLRQHVARELGVLDHPRWSVRPGITGWAQVRNSSPVTVDDQLAKFEADAEYVARRSLRLNLQIMLLTVAIMVRLKGV
jgi:lipopolysaccharide/colanic/teichoic acid biosynthesis glycosyltransferase